MQLSPSLLGAIRLSEAASEAVSTPIEKFPQLISEAALSNATNALADHAAAVFGAEYSPDIETISMPKKNFGPRPIGILSPIGKTVYVALVKSLASALPTPSRAQGYDNHRTFGSEETRAMGNRIVTLDIAACYEYIDHSILSDELLLQSLMPDNVEALTTFLTSIYGRGVGIPQAQESSHFLADAYLGRMERGLWRSGYELNRFADDFRLVTNDWADAHRAIELAAEHARQIGLTLADGKTEIRSPEQLREEESSYDRALNEYRDKAANALASLTIVERGYDDYEVELTEADPADIDFSALKRVVKDWVSRDREATDGQAYFARYGSAVLEALTKAPERIKTSDLVEIVTREPLRLISVLSYLEKRPEKDRNLRVLRKLTNMERLSPWARVWLLNALSAQDYSASPNSRVNDDLHRWAESCLEDEFEVIRAEAAWALARAGHLDQVRLSQLLARATDLTFFGLCASTGLTDGASSSKLGNAVKRASKLAAAAYAWGQNVAS